MKTTSLNQAAPGRRPRLGPAVSWFKVLLPLSLSGIILATGCASGTHKVTGRLHAQIDPDAVVIYQSLPAHAQIIGTISAVSYHGLTLAQAQADALNVLKKEAAGLGANGIIISNVDDEPLKGARKNATAIFVSP